MVIVMPVVAHGPAVTGPASVVPHGMVARSEPRSRSGSRGAAGARGGGGRVGRRAARTQLLHGETAADDHRSRGGRNRRLGGQRGAELGEQPGPAGPAADVTPGCGGPGAGLVGPCGTTANDAGSGGITCSAAGTLKGTSTRARLAEAGVSPPPSLANVALNAARARCTSTSAFGRVISSTEAISAAPSPCRSLSTRAVR